MNSPTTLIVLIGIVIVAIWMLASRRKSKEVWETTPGGPFEVVLTDETISCTHPKREIETIRWDDVEEIRLVTTSDGPFLPDRWYLFVGDGNGCSIPSEAKGFDQLWDVFKTRFPGFDYGVILQAFEPWG